MEKSKEEKNFYESESEKHVKEIELMNKELERQKKTKEERIKLKMKEFYEFVDLKNQNMKEKNEKEREILFRKINNCLLDYLDVAKKTMFDFNCFVRADTTDLTSIPSDMREYDRCPLRNFTNVGPYNIHGKK